MSLPERGSRLWLKSKIGWKCPVLSVVDRRKEKPTLCQIGQDQTGTLYVTLIQTTSMKWRLKRKWLTGCRLIYIKADLNTPLCIYSTQGLFINFFLISA